MNIIKHFFGALVAACSIAMVPAHAAAIFTVTPSSATASVGDTFGVAINILDGKDLYAYQLSLSYDPAKVKFLSVDEGPFLADAGATYFVPGMDDGAGLVSFNADFLLGAVAGVDGSGIALNFNFEALGAGLAHFGLVDAFALDSTLADLPISLRNGGITVSAVGEVPEPSMAALLLLAALALFATRRTVSIRSEKQG